MKTSKYIFLSMAAVVLAVACKEELNPDNVNKANPGDEVQFGAALPGKTKTVYGEETSTGFPIYWVNGDKVRVASPQCSSSHNSAEYQVAVESEEQNYATSLNKTGDAGVQWGEAETADFYSIYPSTAGTELLVDGSSVTAKLHVDATQFASTTDLGTSYYAQPAEMGNVVMYAKTAGVKNGSTVELHYTPFSTVLEFELTAPDTYTGSQKSEITIQSITLVAPTGTTIAGDFDFSFPSSDSANPSVAAAAGGDNTITLHFLDNNQYTTVLSTTKQTLKAKMCVMPISGVNNLSGWKVEVATSAGTFSKTLSDQTGELKPGLVHKIKLPQLNYASEEWTYNLANWIPSLPDYRNIYLSEISLPGAWYAGSSEDYQATSDIATLWDAGVRAFAVETKTTSTGKGGIFITYDVAQTLPNGIALSGTGGNSTATYDLGTNTVNSGTGSDGKVYYSGTAISGIITNIANAVNETEYAVLVLSYADGGTSGLRPVDFGAWLKLLYDTYSSLTDAVKAKIYQNEITANTTVDDVLGKLILKINVDSNIAMSGTVSSTTFTYENNLPALFSYNPFLFQMTESEKYSVPFFSNLSWQTWGDDTDTHRTYFRAATAQTLVNPFVWCFSSANRTQADTGTDTTIPTYENRQNALSAMMTYSKQIYDASTHNVWFYFNCGGTEATSQTSDSPSPTNFATVMNKWLLETINAKTDPSPLGIVMFNQCTGDNATYYGADIIKAIIEMNSKFYLKHAGTSGSGTGGTEQATATNDATVQNGGDAI
ncbi:MAG: hypothetical protein ACI3Z0_06895 [Candidatus Cryptobacteroides sp.]